MGQELPPRRKGMSNEEYKKILIKAHNRNSFVKMRLIKKLKE